VSDSSRFSIERDGHKAEIDLRGGRVTAYRVRGTEVLAGQEHPDLFAYRGSLLAPWPNRVTDGRWSWRGEQFQLPLNDPTGVDAALHGLAVDADFSLRSRSAAAAVLAHDLAATAGYPFPLQLQVSYALTEEGLDCSLTAINVGDRDAPVGLGVHPYVAAADLVDDLVLTLPAETLLVTDDQWREVGRRPVQAAGLDFRAGRRLGQREVDAAFTDLTRGAGRAVEVVLGRSDGHEVALSSGGTCRWLVVYSGHTLPDDDRRRSIAVEPMTCPPNALATGEIDVVAPGSSLTLDWRFALR
jgi:aldose 1-epimerase